MASSVRMMMERGINQAPQPQFNSTEQQNATFALINNLVFTNSKSVRTSTIILASFNVLAAFGTAASILYDCYWASKRCNPKFKASKFCISAIHPAETFPLVLAIGIFIQGLVFAGVQSQGMQSLFTDNCDVVAQFMFPALHIVPYLQVVFGIECAIRSLRKLPFQARGKYDVTICLGVVLLMLIGTWIPSFVFKEPRNCFASLMWFISRYGTLELIMLATVAGLMIISALTIFIRLSTVTMVDQHQRIAASRMVYYLVLGLMSLALVIPFFVSQMASMGMKKGGDLKLSMMATVVVNLSGLMNGLLHLFLRSNTSTTSFGPKSSRHRNRGKHEIRIWGPNELVFSNHLVDPVSGPRSPQELEGDKARSESRTSLIGVEKISMESMNSPPFRSPANNPPNNQSIGQINPMPAIPEPTKDFPQRCSFRRHIRKQSYSLFPVEATTSSSRPNDNAVSVYDITGLAPPPMLQINGKGHKRDSSIASSATVQIGLRLSHAPEQSRDSAQSIGPLPLPSTTYNPYKSSASPTTATAYNPTAQPKSPSPLQILTNLSPNLQQQQKPRSKPTPISTTIRSPDYIIPAVNKDLPPTPRAELDPLVEAIRVSNTQLTPAVYSPLNDKLSTNGLPSAGVKFPKLVGGGSVASPALSQGQQGGQLSKDWI